MPVLSAFAEGYDMATYVWGLVLAGIVCLTTILLSTYGKGMAKMSSIVIALATGYVLSLIVKTGIAPASLMNTEAIAQHAWF